MNTWPEGVTVWLARTQASGRLTALVTMIRPPFPPLVKDKESMAAGLNTDEARSGGIRCGRTQSGMMI